MNSYRATGRLVRPPMSPLRPGLHAGKGRRDSDALVVGVLTLMATAIALYDLVLLALNFH